MLIDLSRKRELAKRNLINNYIEIFEFLVKEVTGKDSKKSPKKQAAQVSKKPVFVKIKKEPGTSDKASDEMSLEETGHKPSKPSSKPIPKKKINGHAHSKAVTPVTKAVNGRLAVKEEANGKTVPKSKKSPAKKKSQANGTDKDTRSPTISNKKKPAVIEVKSQSSEEESESEQSKEQESEQSNESSEG